MLSLSRLPWMNLRGYPVPGRDPGLFSMLMTLKRLRRNVGRPGIEHGLLTVAPRADIMVTPDDADTEVRRAEPSSSTPNRRTSAWTRPRARDAVAAVDRVRSRILPALPGLGEGELLLEPLPGDRLRSGHRLLISRG